MTETLVDLVRTTSQDRRTVYACPDCGSFLDAPRANPETGDLGRKCIACRTWLTLEPPPERRRPG